MSRILLCICLLITTNVYSSRLNNNIYNDIYKIITGSCIIPSGVTHLDLLRTINYNTFSDTVFVGKNFDHFGITEKITAVWNKQDTALYYEDKFISIDSSEVYSYYWMFNDNKMDFIESWDVDAIILERHLEYKDTVIILKQETFNDYEEKFDVIFRIIFINNNYTIDSIFFDCIGANRHRMSELYVY